MSVLRHLIKNKRVTKKVKNACKNILHLSRKRSIYAREREREREIKANTREKERQRKREIIKLISKDRWMDNSKNL